MGLRFHPQYRSGLGADQFLDYVNLSYRGYLAENWSYEVTAGELVNGASAAVTPTGQRFRREFWQFDATLTAQREWPRRKAGWSFYAGGGLGLIATRRREESVATGTIQTERDLTPSIETTFGWRRRFQRVPLELDLGGRFNYAGRGFGLDGDLSVGLRYRLGGN